MSIEISYQSLKQRRLGILRNSYPGNVMIERIMDRRPPSSTAARQAFEENPSGRSLSSKMCREKLLKLQKISMDNAIQQRKILMDFGTREPTTSNGRATSQHYRCSTAPVSAGQRSRNVMLRRPLFMSSAALLDRRINKGVIDKTLLTINLDAQSYAEKKRNEKIGTDRMPSMNNTNRYPTQPIKRSLSAPAFASITTSDQYQKNATHRPSSSKMKHISFSGERIKRCGLVSGAQPQEPLRNANALYFSQNCQRYTRSPTTKEKQTLPDTGCSNLLDEPFTSIHSHQSTFFDRQSSKFLTTSSFPKRVPMPPKFSRVSRRNNHHLSQRQTKQIEEFSGRTVRFCCTSNQIHEYRENEPIASDTTVVK